MPRRNSVIGVGVSGDSISAVQMSRALGGRGEARIETAARISRQGPGPLTQRDAENLAGVLERGGFEGTRVVLAPARGGVLVQPLELPPRGSGAPLGQIAKAEMARVLRLDPGLVEVAMWDVPPPSRAGNATHVMAAALTKEAGESLAGLLEGVGLEVVAIDARSLAIARAARAWLEPTGISMIIDVSWDGVCIMVVLASRVVFEREVEHLCPAKFCAAAAERWRLEPGTLALALAHPQWPHAGEIVRLASGAQSDFIDALTPEIARSAAYASHRYPQAKLERVLLAGEWAELGGLRERVEAQMHVPTRVVRAMEAMVLGPRVRVEQAGPGAMLALGLAMHPGRAHADREVAA